MDNKPTVANKRANDFIPMKTSLNPFRLRLSSILHAKLPPNLGQLSSDTRSAHVA